MTAKMRKQTGNTARLGPQPTVSVAKEQAQHDLNRTESETCTSPGSHIDRVRIIVFV